MNTFFKNIHIISNPNNLSKFFGTALKLSQLGIQFSEYRGASGKILNNYHNNLEVDKNQVPNLLAQNYSHYNLIENTKRFNYENVLIFEDDLLLHKDFLKLMKRNIEFLKTVEWDLCYFGFVIDFIDEKGNICPTFLKEEVIRVQDISKNHNIYFLHSYAVNYTIYDRILNSISKHRRFIDDHLDQEINKNKELNTFIFNPSCTIQIPDGYIDKFGNIGNCKSNYQVNPYFSSFSDYS